MKTILSVLALIICLKYSEAQTVTSGVQTGLPVEMLFPGAKTKALILSYDD